MKYSKKWYQNMPEKLSTSANSNTKILWDVEIDGKVKHNRPNITIKEKNAMEWCFLHVTVSQDHRVTERKNKKVDNYLELAEKARTERHVKVKIIPIVIGAMRTILKQLKNYISPLGISNIIERAQASVLIGTGRTLRNVISLQGQGLLRGN